MSEPRTVEEFWASVADGPDYPRAREHLVWATWEASDKATRAALLADRPDVALARKWAMRSTCPEDERGLCRLVKSNCPCESDLMVVKTLESLAAQLAASQEEVKRLREPTEAMLQNGARAYEEQLDRERPGNRARIHAMSAAWDAILSSAVIATKEPTR